MVDNSVAVGKAVAQHVHFKPPPVHNMVSLLGALNPSVRALDGVPLGCIAIPYTFNRWPEGAGKPPCYLRCPFLRSNFDVPITVNSRPRRGGGRSFRCVIFFLFTLALLI